MKSWEFFVAQVSQYFSDSLVVLQALAIQGATQLSEIIVDSDGNYYADGVMFVSGYGK